ncbi:hypothetical protein ACFL4Z_02545 [candidate division KSB1 bacterium]
MLEFNHQSVLFIFGAFFSAIKFRSLTIIKSVSICFLITLVLILFFGAELYATTYLTQTEEMIIMGNDRLEVGLSRVDGTIFRLINREDGVDYCNQTGTFLRTENMSIGKRIGGVMIHDELRGKLFSDLETSSEITEIKAEKNYNGVSCNFEKRFEGAEFVLHQRMILQDDHLRWEVDAVKLSGADRSLKMVLFVPMPIWGYNCWAPIAEAPFKVTPWVPFQINFGQADEGSVGNNTWRTVIPTVVFYHPEKRNALCLVSPFEIPAVRIRFRNNVSATEDFHLNSRNYSLKEKPYLQVASEYLGLRDNRAAKTGLLITVQPSDWRPSLGWVYEHYREYFDPEAGFDKYDGVFAMGVPLMADNLSDQQLDEIVRKRYEIGARWEEHHGHFPRYGLMIPDKSVESWDCESHPRRGHTKTRAKIAAHAERNKQNGIGTFIYYNTTEAEWKYASEKYPEDIAYDENGRTIRAYRGETYPDDRACWLMNSDPSTKFGRDLAEQAEEMVRAYPGIAGFFWDVYGRSYCFDFDSDDGITMVNNKPAYYPIFMYLRMMEKHIIPLLHGSGRYITCNKPTVIQACKGIDAIMARERTPELLKPEWLVAQSYLGLNRHVMILDGSSWQHPERLFLNCLRYGFFYSEVMTGTERITNPEVILQKQKAEEIRQSYHPIIERLRGKKWIFYPKALELPSMTDGNIFRLNDGSVMLTMVSIWRVLNDVPGTVSDLELTCRLPDATEFKNFHLIQPDLGRKIKITPLSSGADFLTFRLSEHGKASVILLER